MKVLNFVEFLKHTHFISILLLPALLVTGPFLPDLVCVISSLFFLFFAINEKKFFYFKNFFFLIFLIWCFYLVVRSFLSSDILLSLESSLFHFRFGFFFLSIWYAIDNYKSFNIFFFYSILLVFLILCLDGYLQFFTGKNILGFAYNGYRLTGFFNDEAILGSYLARLSPLLFACLASFKSKNIVSFLTIFFVLTSVDILIFLSGERTAFFYTLLSTFTIIFLVQKWKLIRIFTFILSLFFITFITYNNESIKYRMIDQTLDQLNISSEKNTNPNYFTPQHEALYISALTLFKENIYFGIGPKLFRKECSKVDLNEVKSTFIGQDFNLNTIDTCSPHPHNTYVQLLTETGIIGTVPIIFVFLICIFYLFKHFLFLFKGSFFLTDYRICLLTCIMISLWPLVPSGNFFNNWLNIIYFLPVGFLLQDIKAKNE